MNLELCVIAEIKITKIQKNLEPIYLLTQFV